MLSSILSIVHDPVTNRRNRQRPLLCRSRLGYQRPPGRQRTMPAFPHLAGQLTEHPGNPVLLDSGQGDLVNARRAIIAARRNPRAPQDVLRLTLSYSAWNLRPRPTGANCSRCHRKGSRASTSACPISPSCYAATTHPPNSATPSSTPTSPPDPARPSPAIQPRPLSELPSRPAIVIGLMLKRKDSVE